MRGGEEVVWMGVFVGDFFFSSPLLVVGGRLHLGYGTGLVGFGIALGSFVSTTWYGGLGRVRGSMVGFPVLVSLLSSSTDISISDPSREGKGLTALVGVPSPVSCSWLFSSFFLLCHN